MRIFIISTIFLFGCSFFLHPQEKKIEQVVFEQVSNIILSLGDITANPNDPDTAEALLKNIISGAFVIGKKISQEEMNNKRFNTKFLDCEILWDRLACEDKNKLITMLTGNV